MFCVLPHGEWGVWIRINRFFKNLNASRPSIFPQSGGKMSKRLGGIICCKYKTSLCDMCSRHVGAPNLQHNINTPV